MARWLDARAADFADAFTSLLSMKRETEEDVAASVRAIIADVRRRGDAALIELGGRFDKVTLTAATLRLSDADIAAAAACCGREALKGLDVAAKRIE
ncbi:MAG: histidinol dehydrogenase, partial [Alphaproteobacteria bacterium]|nr:histidinol dehydrogenase [Alphaproteobacteria bacterium]